MRGLATRLKRLEQNRPAPCIDERCPTCGRQMNGRHAANEKVQLKVTFDDAGEPDTCPTCGARLVLRLSFDERS